MMSYKDTTFCSAQCGDMTCHRNMSGAYYGGGPIEVWMPVAIADFADGCPEYIPVNDMELEVDMVS